MTLYVAFHRWACLVVSRNGDIEKNRRNGKKIEKNYFPYLYLLGYQKLTYVGGILKKSLQGSIHAQFYMAIKGPLGRFLLQLCRVSVKQRKNKFTTLRRDGILVKALPDRCVEKQACMPVNVTVHISTFTRLGVLTRATINRRSGRHPRRNAK